MINQTLEELHVQAQYRLVEKLRESEARYRSLFNSAPIGLWEQDWSLVKLALDKLTTAINLPLADYFQQSPQQVRQIAGLIKVIDVNDMALKHAGLSSKQQLSNGVNNYLNDNSLDHVAKILIAFAKGKTHYETECPLQHPDGQEFIHYLSIIVLPGHEHDLDSLIVTTSDITTSKQAEIALQNSKEFLRMSQLAGGIGTWEANLLTNQQIWSEAVISNLGFPECEAPTWFDFISAVHPEDRQMVTDAVKAHIDRYQKYTIEYRIIDKHGAVRWMCSTGDTERDNTGRPLIFRGVVQEITDRKLAEEKLRLSEKIIQTTQEGILITDEHSCIVDVNAAFCRMTGYSRDEIIGNNPRLFKSGRHDAEFYSQMWQTINAVGHWTGEIWNRRKDGGVYAELISISAIRDAQGRLTHYVSSLSDITLLKQHEKQLEHIAHYDALTGIPNRVLLADRMKQAQSQARREDKLLAICYLDLDGFKAINDSLGHAAGDTVLIEVSKRIGHSLRGSDTVARLGGDEFVILLLDIEDIQECNSSLERLLSVIAEPVMLQGQLYTVTASIGATLYPHDKEDPDTLLRHADQAMYMAKRLGKNRYYIFDACQEQQIKLLHHQLLRIEQGLHDNEFVLFYQPKVALSSYRIVGFEALIRWQHPERGLLSPDKFLPIIEDTLLEIVCGEWVIDAALNQMEQWLAQGLALQVSINISASHLQSPNFVESLRQKLAQHPQLTGQQLQIEILETAALIDVTKVAVIIAECAEFGISFALDDFGTGYSSLSYLRRLPADTLKIDLSFVRDMLVDKDDRAIVKGVISLGHTFNRITVAEGVETQAHFDLLREMGCDTGQGFGIARPMPASEIIDWCKDYSGKVSDLQQHNTQLINQYKSIAWDSQFEIGHGRIDSEHRVFLSLIIDVSHEINGDADSQRIKRLLNEITEYAKFHFVSEENIMEEIGFPDLEIHRLQHRRLLSKLSDITYDLAQQQLAYAELVDFLFEWFANHTSIEDRKIAEFMFSMTS